MAAISTLTDNFDDNSIDAKWTVAAGAGTVTETGQRLEITSTTNGTSSSLTSDAYYDMTGDAVYVRLARSAGTGDHYLWLQVLDAGGDGYRVVTYATTLIMQRMVGGETQVGGTYGYDATTHGWFRLREAAGTMYGDTAPSTAADPPGSGEWTNRWSETTDAAVDITALRVRLGSLSATSANPSTIWFDGVNTATTAGGGSAVGAARYYYNRMMGV